MASIVPGYEYDIFISYRQKDNKHDGWVTEFVNNLKGELESTFKEEISVYFDINPHDGLLETHDVNASLKEKLKCLIFIPIISRTYCDPKSFAWEHEFKAFVEIASQDQFGLKVKLPGGNVSSRVLPVQIHDLNAEDRKLVEGELGGYLRGIEFIYKEPGVNRPLMANEDHPDNNLNKTFYRNQINKVANAINEIIDGLKDPDHSGKGIADKIVVEKPYGKINRRTKIITGALIVLALIVAGYFIVPKLINQKGQIEKSIAVLPFINDSPDKENTYTIDGIMDEIINSLQKISDFSRVLPRTSVEQFRGETKLSIPVIAKKLNVNYIVQGSGKKYGNKFVLGVQLIAAHNEKQLWGKSYDREIRETSDIISIQSDIAQSIAAELKATMTPDEKQLIDKIPTANLTALDFYQRGREEHTKYWINNSNRAALQKAEDLYHKALKYDSTYAQAYTGLARVYWDKNYGKEKEYFSENFMDSILILTNIAVSLDNQLSEAYTLRGKYYNEIGKPEQAIEEFDKAIKFNPNSWEAFYEKGNLYLNADRVTAIENLQKAAFLNHGSELPLILGSLSKTFLYAGFIEKAKDYAVEVFKLVGDTTRYLDYLAEIEVFQSNYEKALEYLREGYSIDSNNVMILSDLGYCYSFTGQFKESLKYNKKYVEREETLGQFDLQGTQRIGYAYWQNGNKKEAEYYFDKQIEYCKNSIQNSRPYALSKAAYYDLAGVYAFRGNKEKAYENLRIFNQIQKISFVILMIMKDDPLFESIRKEPEFQQIVRDVEAKYQAEHERVRKWIEENKML